MPKVAKKKPSPFGPRNAREVVVFAQEELRVHVEYAFHKALKVLHLSRGTVCRRAKVPVRKLAHNAGDLTVYEIASLFQAMGCKASFNPDGGRGWHPHYTSTYCIHQDHEHCRMTCKTCKAPCLCECHGGSHGQ